MSVAFVAGATGYTGREVVRELVARGVHTIAHVRSDSSRLEQLRRELESEGAVVDVTPWSDAEMVATLSRHSPRFVFSLLGTTRARVGQSGAESYDSVDYGLTALVLRAALRCGSRPRFVYLSALGAGRPSKNPYYAARFKLETELRVSGLPYVIARPGLITGPDRAESRLGERVAAGLVDGSLALVGLVGGGRFRDRFASMNAKILARGLVSLGLDAEESRCVADPSLIRARAGEPRGV